jgi:hypothetical protein
MLIELYKDSHGLVTGFRHSWGPFAVKPFTENVFDIRAADFNCLVEFLAGRPVTVSPLQGQGDFASGTLALVALDIATTEVFKSDNSGFFETAKGI